MKKHQFVKVDCNCAKRATYFVCKFCGARELCSVREVRALDVLHATCPHADAPDVPPAEKFKALMGGSIDCLAPDFETWDEKRTRQEGGGETS